jgi:AraC-like DNA-binding protein
MDPTLIAEQDAGTDAEFERLHADSLRFFPQLVADLGGDADALLRRVGIEPSIFSTRGPGLGYRAMANLLEHAAVELQRPDFGMRLAMLQGGGKVFGPMGVVMRNSSTLGEALDYVVKHVHAYSLAARIQFEPDRAGRRLLVAFEVLLDRLPDKRQAIEQALLLANLNAIEITGGRARVREVLFRHQPVSAPRTYRDYFGCKVRFDQKTDGVVFTAQDLLCPTVDPDAQLYEIATSFIDTRFTRSIPPLHAQVRGLMLRHLGGEDCTNERIAAELGLHPRTLHRRLRAEGKSFQEIKDEVRRDLAQYHLQHTDMPLVRIAEKLGYAESSVFSRSCLRWFGASPRQLRSGAERSARSPRADLDQPHGRQRGRGNGGASRAQGDAPRQRDAGNPGGSTSVAPGGSTAMVRVDVLGKFAELVALLGGDAGALLAKAQIDPGILANPHAVISFRSFVQLLERAALDLACPDFGMRLASAQDVAKVLGPLGVVMRNSGTLREAFRYCAEHIQAYSTGTRLSIQEDRSRHSVFLRFETQVAKLPHHPQAVEHALLLTRHNALDLSRGQVRAREVWFTHQPLSPLATYRSYFGANVRFGQRMNGVVFARRDFDRSIPDRDPQLYELVTDFIEQRFPTREPVLGTRVRALVERLLIAGGCSHVGVAADLGMHPRTLQRRLRAEGASFETLKDEVRRDIALRYLKQPAIPLIRVAELLGYSSTSVLSRSCQRWFSASPRQLRVGSWR